jgi:hypothetical protein
LKEKVMSKKDRAARDLPPEAGKRPVFARPVDRDAGEAIGTGPGYSGQEYDAPGQAEWCAEQAKRAMPQDGAVHGSGTGAGGGAPGEDYDSDSAGGSGA